MSDQAEGLRRLLSQRGTRVVGVLSGGRGAGASTVVANLAVALSRRGRNVLVLDEQGGSRGAGALLACVPRATLGDAVAGRVPLTYALAEAAPGLRVLAAGDAAAVLRGPEPPAAFAAAVNSVLPDLDAVLIDAGPGPGTDRVSLTLAAPEMAVVLGGHATSLKDGYALIKLVNRLYARRQFQVIVNRAQESGARTQADNLARTSLRYLGVTPSLIGAVPKDDCIARAARLSRPVVDAFADAPAAAAFRAMAETFETALPGADPAPGGPLLKLLTQSSRLFAEPARAAIQ